MNILVTGASGFLGRHIVKRLKEMKYKVRAMVRQTSNTKGLNKDMLVYADISGKGLQDATKNIDVVIHSAGIVKARNIEDFYEVNTRGTERLLDAAKKNGVKRFIFISSQAAAGPSKDAKGIDEGYPCLPVSHYGKSKLEAESIVKTFKNHVIFRPSGIYGPGDWEFLTIIKYVKKGIKPFFGFRDMFLSLIYVEDAVRVIVEGIKKGSGVYFLSDGVSYPLKHFYKRLEDIFYKEARSIHIPLFFMKAFARFGTVFDKNGMLNRDKVEEMMFPYWVVKIDKLVRDFNFKPQFTLKKGLVETIDWYRKEGLF